MGAVGSLAPSSGAQGLSVSCGPQRLRGASRETRWHGRGEVSRKRPTTTSGPASVQSKRDSVVKLCVPVMGDKVAIISRAIHGDGTSGAGSGPLDGEEMTGS